MEAGAHTFLRICPHLFAAIPSQFPDTWPLLPVLYDFFVEGMVPCQKTVRPSLSSRSPQGVRAYFPELRYQNAGLPYACPRPWGLPSNPKRSHSATHLSYRKTRPFSSFWGGGWVSLGWIHMLPSSFPSFRSSLLHSSTRSRGQASSLKLLILTLSNREIIAVGQPSEIPLRMRTADAFVLRMRAIAHCGNLGTCSTLFTHPAPPQLQSYPVHSCVFFSVQEQIVEHAGKHYPRRKSCLFSR